MKHHASLKKIIAATAAALCCGCAEGERPLYEKLETPTGEFSSVDIPLRFERGMPWITIQVQGKEIELDLDTGASSVTFGLAEKDLEGLNYKEAGGPVGSLMAYGTSVYRRLLLPEVRFGGLVYRGLLCDLALTPLPPSRTRRGRMGAALLRDFGVLLDYGASKMTLYRRGLAPADLAAWRRVPFNAYGNFVVIRGSLLGSPRQLGFVLDTGAVGINDANGESANNMEVSAFELVKDLPHTTEGGFKVMRNQPLELEGEVLEGLNFIFDHGLNDKLLPNFEGGLLGYEFLRKYRVFIDFANSELYFQKYQIR